MSKAPSGWTSGFFRVDAEPGPAGQPMHVHRHRVTGEIAPQPYDLTEANPFTDWEPLYVWRGVKGAPKPDIESTSGLCGARSPGGAMTCVRVASHITLPERVLHTGRAADGSKRTWRE